MVGCPPSSGSSCLSRGPAPCGRSSRGGTFFGSSIGDLGVGESDCYGGRLPTPNLDRLSREGIRFSEAYVTAPYCAPSRASLLTGRRCSRIGFEFNPVGPQNEDPRAGLALSETRVASRLKLAGYATSALGSGTWGRHLPTTRSGVVLTNSLVFFTRDIFMFLRRGRGTSPG